jgi:Xaa-Pro aminopeptidase
VLGKTSAARAGALFFKRGTRQAASPFIRGLAFGASGKDPVANRDLETELGALRQIKDEDEIRRLRRAIGITGEALRETMREARPGMYEYELEGRVEYGFRQRGAERLGFPSIVGSGPNGTTLHYDENRRQTRPGELVVMDVGAEHGYYSADVTRTIPISGRFNRRQRELYELVLGAQQAAMDSVRPGSDLATLNRLARDYMRQHSGKLCGESGCERYFIHGLSHWLGMDVHDVGAYSRRLEPGMVFTIEPGIYIPAESIGIRIEDDILVTPGGAEVLSSGVPRTVEEVEQAMAGR